MNALIALLQACVNHNESNAVDMRRYLIEPEYFDALWMLYFDPLLIKNAIFTSNDVCTDAINRTDFFINQHIKVVWSDGREDICRTGVVHPRLRVDTLVHQALNACENSQQLINLLHQMHLAPLEAKHVFPSWLRLFRFLKNLNHFDVTVCDMLFDRLKNMRMVDFENELQQFIRDLFDEWPTLSDIEQHNSFSTHLVQLIQILIDYHPKDSNILIEQLTESICGKTLVDNARGHLCFFSLLKTLLPPYYQAGLINAIKKVDTNTVLWYVNYVINQDTASDHNLALLTIMKHVCMYTDYDYLRALFEILVSHPLSEFSYQLIVHASYLTTTIPIFAQNANEEAIIQFLNIIRCDLAKNFISVLLIIVESLAKTPRTQKSLFQANDLHIIVQNWLLLTTESKMLIRMIALLLDIGSSTNDKCALDIAHFFLDTYAPTLLATNFEGFSPLPSIILFVNSLCNEETKTTSASSSIQLKLKELFESLFRLIETTNDQEQLIGYSHHLKSLSGEIVQERARTTLTRLLSPFIYNIIGLLGGASLMRRPSIVFLSEILDWSANERSIFDDLIQNPTNIDQLAESIKNTRQIEQRVSFFSTERAHKIDLGRIKHENFVTANQLLSNLANADSTKIDQILRDHVPYKTSYVKPADNEVPSDRLIMTNTTRENVSKILEVLDDPIPILLEGSTGVGKSACVMEAAEQSNRKLNRLNMSSRITIDDLLGKVTLSSDAGKAFEFVEGPFTTAFSQGQWILLDELNLGQDTVLQAIESALDTRRLILQNSSSAEQSLIVHSMHKNFRLFATQNPNTGFFKGKREKLSPSFLSRFRPIIFKELPDNEWCEIAERRLLSHFQVESKPLAELMVTNFNVWLRNKFKNTEKASLEVGPYAEITIRELLKWIDLLIWQKTKGPWSSNANERNAWLSFSAWCVYGARYRGSGRILVQEVLTNDGKGGWGGSGLEKKIQFIMDQSRNQINFDNVYCSTLIDVQFLNTHQEWDNIFVTTDLNPVPIFDSIAWDSALKVHKAVHKTVLDSEFIKNNGIYRINMSWLFEWLISAARNKCMQKTNEFAVDGCHMYQIRFRHLQARTKIRECFSQVFKSVDFNQTSTKQYFIRPEIPYVLTDRVLATLKQVCFNRYIKQPILVTGAEGCGKSELLLILAWLCGQSVQQLNITPETEPSALIGQMIPNDRQDTPDGKSQKLIWENGCVTKAFLEGQWVLLDNLNAAESSVLERLNPILEQNPMLILTENVDDEKLAMHKNYQLVATMTSPDTRCQSSQTSANELSPALYNRFGIVHMPDVSFDAEDKSSELLKMIKALLSDEFNESDYKLALDFCSTILRLYRNKPQSFPKLTLRNIVRLFDSAYLLRSKFPSQLDFISSLWAAYHVTIATQIKDDQTNDELTKDIHHLLLSNQSTSELRLPTFIDWIEKNDSYILTDSRKAYANAVLGAVTCNIPLLLEGPAAVGKTALISGLCKHLQVGTVNPNSTAHIELERVNNTDTTTTQDYLGTYLPINDGFVFQKGALYRAMENGWWFLADEFNLADPSVMNMLFPLLEGKTTITIPSTGKIITARPGFHFFATQNDASYANRYQLPVSLRNRFLEVQFKEFPEKELPQIIAQRKQIGKEKPPCMSENSSVKLAQFYHRVTGTRLAITFRELVKWLHRHAILSPDKELWPIIGVSLLAAKYPLHAKMRDELISHLGAVWQEWGSPTSWRVNIRSMDADVRFTEGDLSIDVKNMKLDDRIVESSPLTFKRSLVRLALAVHAKEPVLLVGPTSCKTLLVETWAQLTKRSAELIKVHLTPDTEAGDLIGEIQPCSFFELLRRLPVMAERVCMRFETLCRQGNTNTGKLDFNEELLLRNVRELITGKLPQLIDDFEKADLRQEEHRRQKEDLYDNMNALLEQTRAMQMPPPIDVIDNPSSEIGTAMTWYESSSSTFTPLADTQYAEHLDTTYIPFDSSYSGNFMMYQGQTLDSSSTTNMDFFDDGLGSQLPLAQPDMTSAVYSTTDFDDGLGGISITTLTSDQSVQSYITNSNNQEPTPYDDGLGGIGVITSTSDQSVQSDITNSVNQEQTPYDDGLGGIGVITSTDFQSTQSDITTSANQEQTSYDDGLGGIATLPSMNFPSTAEEQASFADGLSSTTNTALDNDSSSSSKPEPVRPVKYSPELLSMVNTIRTHFDNMMKHENDSFSIGADKTLLDYHGKFIKVWNDLTAPNIDRSKPMFLFNDGPVTMAAKRGGILFLEDLDLPSQAVIERLNSMLEPSPTFALTEDITSQAGKGQLDIVLSNNFQIFASVHQDQIHQILKLSPATRSRFTEIHVQPYEEMELQQLVTGEFKKHNFDDNEISSLVKTIFSLRETLRNDPDWKLTVDIRLLLRWTDFIVKHHQGISVEYRMFLGARFFYFDQLPLIRHEDLFKKWLKNQSSSNQYDRYRTIFKAPDTSHGLLAFKLPQTTNSDDQQKMETTDSDEQQIVETTDSDEQQIVETTDSDEQKQPFPFEIGDDYIALRYTGVRCSCKFNPDEDESKRMKTIRDRFNSVPTRTLLNQIARIFAATSSRNPLLLEGPPGIGKTHVVNQVCSLLNRECERINMSANTSLDQLIGCVIPRIINGVRVFQWQEGRLLSAIAAKRWILLDELNLASSEVLEGLAPLFYRSVNSYTVPNTGKTIDLSDVLIFATMNPSTIGGGRNKLPRSISNLFTIVQLDEYSPEELHVILIGEFLEELKEKKINMDQLEDVFRMHRSIKASVREGKLGRTGGPYEVNLRDLSKFHNVFHDSIDTQLFHYQYMNTTDEEQEKKEEKSATQTTSTNSNDKLSSTINASDARLLAIRKFAQVVYACQFQGQSDFDKACEIINDKFKLNIVLTQRDDDHSIDTAVPSVIRIGSIYVSTGSELPSPSDMGLIHTKKTVRQLELLAVACQSKRAVLLEGDICSRKSSLVIELARLTRHRLLIMAMHENFETSDLIGSWLPKKTLNQEHPVFEKIDKMFKQITKVLLLLVMPVIPEDSRKDFVEFKEIVCHRMPSEGVTRFDNTPKELEALERIKILLDKMSRIPHIPNEVKIHLSCYIRQSGYFVEKIEELQQNNTNQKQEMGFEFVESEFIRAIREGWWVLLDNVNSAPPEVLERLNSLTEEKPMLSLYENSDGKVLRRGEGIHENFRLFTTANLNRIYSNKLSSAFLNRVIRLWLPVIDEIDPEKPKESDLYELVSHQLIKIPAGKQLAHLLILTHYNVKRSVQENKLVYPSDFAVTYRLLEQCVQTLLSLIDHHVSPVDACYWSLLRCYCSSLQNNAQYQEFIEQLQKTINELGLCSSTTSFSSALDELDRQQPIWYQESQPIRSTFLQLERFLIEHIFTLINIVAQDKTSIRPTRELLILFIDNLLLPMKPTDIKLTQTRQNLSTDDQKLNDLVPTLNNLEKDQQLMVRISLKQIGTVPHAIEELIRLSELSSICDELTISLEKFVSNTSFKDNDERFDFLRRVISIIETFEQFLSVSIFDDFDRRINVSQFSSHLIQTLRPLLKFKEKYRSFELFQDVTFIEVKEAFHKHIFQHLDDGLIWSFERAQSYPIRSSRKNLRNLVQYMLNDVERKSIIGPIQHFASVLEWISLQWNFDEYLISNVRHALQKNVGLNRDFILECQLKFYSLELVNELNKMTKELVFHLPVESSTLNTDYWHMDTELRSKGIVPEQSPQGSDTTEVDKLKGDWNRFDQDRSKVIKKAIVARTKLNENLNKLLTSEAYQFVRDRLEEPDAKQLNIFCRLLHEARRNPFLNGNDGILDLRAVLGTSIGRMWVEHDNLLETPIVFFLCGYYFLSNLHNRTPIQIISDWKQLEEDIDVRSTHPSDMLFFCPSKHNYDCCLISIQNEARTVLIRLWSLQGDINTNELDNVLPRILPEGINHRIEQQSLPAIDSVLPPNSPQTFGLACLIYLYQQTSAPTSWPSEIYTRTMFIFNQVKEYVRLNVNERKPLLASIYHNIHRLQRELEILNLSNTSIDPWEINIQQMWTLLKPYQDSFSSVVAQKIDQQFKNSIQSVRPSTSVGRLTLLGYLETLKTNYTCVHAIIGYLHEGMTETILRSIDDFHLLFDFINKMDRLLKLITQYVTYAGDQFSQEIYEQTPLMIAHLEEIYRSTLKVVEIIDDQLDIGVKQNAATFEDWQMKLNEYLAEIRFPLALLSQYELMDIVINLAPLYDEHRQTTLINTSSTMRRTSSFGSMKDPQEARKETQQSRINAAIGTMKNSLSRAGHLPIRPHSLVQHIHTILNKLKTFDLSQETEADYNRLLSEEQRVIEQLNEFERKINEYTTFNVNLPRDEPIHRIDEEELVLIPGRTDLINVESQLTKITDDIQKCNEARPLAALTQIIHLTHAQVSDQTWLRVMNLLKPSQNIEELRNALMTFRDDLAMDIERDPKKTVDIDIIADRVTLAYSQFRCDLLIEESEQDMLMNYTTVSSLSISLREWMKKVDLNVFNMFETIKAIGDDLNRARNQMKSFSKDASCSLLPVDLRPEDIFCLLAPEYTTHVRITCDQFQQIDDFLAGRIDRVETMPKLPTSTSIKALTGLASFEHQDPKDKTKTYPFFDLAKDIHDIVTEATKMIQELVALLTDQSIREGLLMSNSTSLKELFPIHICLSLTLMVLIDWASIKLCDSFPHVHQLSMSTMKSLEDEVKTLEKNLYEGQKNLKQLKDNHLRISDEYREAEREYQRVLHDAQFLVAAKEKKVKDCRERKERIDTEMKKKEDEVAVIREDFEQKRTAFEVRRKQEQEQWFANLKEHFQLITTAVNECVSSLSSKSSLSSATDLLNTIVSMGRQYMIESVRVSMNSDDLQINRDEIFKLLITLQNHANDLLERDPMFSFLLFYCDVMHIALRSLWQSVSNWNLYSEVLQNASVQSYAKDNNKKIVCKLAGQTFDQCQDFLNKVRHGYDQNDVIKLAQTIGSEMKDGVKSLELVLTGPFSEHLQYLLRDFERFLYGFLIAGCRFSQLQRGIREPLDDILKGIINHDIDAHLPRTEAGLLEILETYEDQMKSYKTTLLYQNLHIVFTFNSNPFDLFEKLDRSVKALIQLVLPTAHLLKGTWMTVNELVVKLASNILKDENDILTNLCIDFVRLTKDECKIDHEIDYLNKQVKLDLFESIWKHLDQLTDILQQNRPVMKKFCENIMKRWHLAIQELFRGFIKSRKFDLHRRLEWNQRQFKEFGQLFSSAYISEPFRLADIERILLYKNLILINLNPEERSKRWIVLQDLQILYQLITAGADNLENTLMNMPIEQLDNRIFFKLIEMTGDIYDKSVTTLTEQPLTTFIYDEQIMKDSFNLLNRIHRLEYDLYKDFYDRSKETVERSYNDLLWTADFGSLLKQSKQANAQWLTACETFVELRQKTRKDERNLVHRVGHGITQRLASLKSHGSKDFDHIFNELIQGIALLMNSGQKGREWAFVMPKQDQFVKLLELHSQYRSRLHLAPLDNSFFITMDQVYVLNIYRYQPSLTKMTLHFWNSPNLLPNPLEISLGGEYEKIVIALNTMVTEISVDIQSHGEGPKMEWSKFINSSELYRWESFLTIKCFRPTRGQPYYGVKSIDELSCKGSSMTTEEIQEMLNHLEKSLQKELEKRKEEDTLKQSAITKALKTLEMNVEKITVLSRCQPLNQLDLTNLSGIYRFFQQIPTSTKLTEAFELLRIKDFDLVPSHISLVEDTDPAINQSISLIWTKLMHDAFSTTKRVFSELIDRLYCVSDQLRICKAQLLLCYVWANTIPPMNVSNSVQGNFSVMQSECLKLCQLPKANNEQSFKSFQQCRWSTYDAQRLYQTLKRSTNNWIEVQHLQNISFTSIKGDLLKAFSHSQLGRDAHLWLIEVAKTDTTPATLTCHPKLAPVDFGATLNGIYQRSSQRVFIHNESGGDLNVRIDRIITQDSLFEVSNENIPVKAEDICEMEVFLRSSINTGSAHDEDWDLVVGDTDSFSKALRAQVKIVEIDVKISDEETIDFGVVPCHGSRIEKSIEITNVSPCSIRIKAQLQKTETQNYDSDLTILKNELNLAADNTESFAVSLEPSKNIQDINALVCLAIQSLKHCKWIKVCAQIRETHLTVSYNGYRILNNTTSGRLTIDDFYKGEKRIIPIEFHNSGPVAFTLRISWDHSKHDVVELKLNPGDTKKLEKEIQMPVGLGRTSFNQSIEFVNINRSCQWILTCETASSVLTQKFATADNRQLIKIAQLSDMENIMRRNLDFECQVYFKNLSKASATLCFSRLVSRQDSTKVLSTRFRIEPHNVLIKPNTDMAVQFIYSAVDLRTLEANVELSSNTSVQPLIYPFVVDFQMPVLEIIPRTVVDIGIIQNGKITKEKILTVKNIGQQIVRFHTLKFVPQQSFVKQMALQDLSKPNQPISIHPKYSHSLSMIVECEQIPQSSELDLIELGTFELISLYDPVIDLDGKLSQRTITVVIVGHLQSSSNFNLPMPKPPSSWSSLKLLPSMWLYEISKNYTTHIDYVPLVVLTANAYVCSFPQIDQNLPCTAEEWSVFFESFQLLPKENEEADRMEKAVEKLMTDVQSSSIAYLEYFHYLSFFYQSFSTVDTVRLQLYSMINSAANVDEAYAMQRYTSIFWETYQTCTITDVSSKIVEFMRRCIGNDRMMNEKAREFINFIHQATLSSTSDDMAQHLQPLILPDSVLGEILALIADPSSLKWNLLFLLFPQHIKEILIRFLKGQHQALLELYLMGTRQIQTDSFQRSLLMTVKKASSQWNTLSSAEKSNLLSPFLKTHSFLLFWVSEMSNAQLPELSSILGITESFLRQVYPSISFEFITKAFQKLIQSDIERELSLAEHFDRSKLSDFSLAIRHFKSKLTRSNTNDYLIDSAYINEYCEILQRLTNLNAPQWSLLRDRIMSAWRLLKAAGQPHTTLSDMIDQVLQLIIVLDTTKNWPQIQNSLREACREPTWTTVYNLIEIIDDEKTLVQLIQAIKTAKTTKDLAETVLALGCEISSKKDVELLNTHESAIRHLELISSSQVDCLKQIQQFVPQTTREHITAYLTLLRLPSLSLMNTDDQHYFLDNLVPAWLTLFDMKCNKLIRLFEIFSSILTSFHGLVVTQDVPLSRALYSTSMATALCSMAHCRQNTRETFISNHRSTPSKTPLILTEIIRDKLAPGSTEFVSSNPTPIQSTIPAQPVIESSLNTAKEPDKGPYTDETFIKMENSVQKFLGHEPSPAETFTELDSIDKILTTTQKYRLQVTQWYGTFTTFNILVRYRSNKDQQMQIKASHAIIQNGLQLFQNLLIVKKIIEQTFSGAGARFLLNDLARLEKCFRSLELDQCPDLLHALRQLHVNVCVVQDDVPLPSPSAASQDMSIAKTKLNILQQLNTKLDSSAQNNQNESKPIRHVDKSPSANEVKNFMQQTNVDKTSNKTKSTGKARKPQPQSNDNKNVQRRLEALASEMFHTNMQVTTVNFTNKDNNETNSSTMNNLTLEIDIDQQRKFIQEHLHQQPNLVEMYEKINEQTSTIISDNKLDIRPALQVVGKPNQWTYQTLIEIPSIVRMIDLLVKNFRLSWNKLIDKKNSLEKHYIHWCILIDNSGSMSAHRNAIYESVVVLMEALRKLESKFAVARFGGQKNQKILKNLHELFTVKDGEYVLQALTFDEGTYPATGLARVAESVFSSKETKVAAGAVIHRLVLMITDGLTSERNDGRYTETIKKNNINLGFLFIETGKQNNSQVLLRGLGQTENCVLKENEIDQLPFQISSLMDKMVIRCSTEETSPTSSTTVSKNMEVGRSFVRKEIVLGFLEFN